MRAFLRLMKMELTKQRIAEPRPQREITEAAGGQTEFTDETADNISFV